ncbi:MAG: NAD(P)/FAD-dependent oxidoreductase [Candidatus Syntropharchaeia archaeon]
MPRIVIIGGGEAGTSVVDSMLRKGIDTKEWEITLLKKEKRGAVSICGLPFALQGIYSVKDIEYAEPKYFIDKGIDYRTGCEATNIDLEDKTVTIDTGEKIKYDYLVIATGRKPFVPPIPGTELEGVYTMSNIEDGERIESAMEEAEKAAVIGAGIIGLQTAVAFSKRGIKTVVIEALPSLLPSILDSDMASIVQKWLEKEEILFLLNKTVSAIRGDGRRVKSVLVGNDEIPADIVVIAAGMHPNVELAERAGLEIGKTGGIVTDCSMHVRKEKNYLNDVYALGDCVEVIDAITHRPRLSQLASTALVQAKVVAYNILGLGSSFEPCLSPTISVISGLQVGSVGITSETAKKYGIKVFSGKKEKPTKPRYYPGRKSMAVKLLFDIHSERLIGAQIVSEDPVADRIDGLSLGIRCGVTVRELRMMEKSFDPSVSLHRDVMIDAAEDAR